MNTVETEPRYYVSELRIGPTNHWSCINWKTISGHTNKAEAIDAANACAIYAVVTEDQEGYVYGNDKPPGANLTEG